ncbi:TPA: hypothetical protein QCU33_001568 [Bacillus cereus]|nr:hypothetical protein [Bacillus cereus]
MSSACTCHIDPEECTYCRYQLLKDDFDFAVKQLEEQRKRIEGLEKELHELKNDVTQEDIKRVEAILDRAEDLCEEHADDKEWLMGKFKKKQLAKAN